jgi:hypothetical protein
MKRTLLAVICIILGFMPLPHFSKPPLSSLNPPEAHAVAVEKKSPVPAPLKDNESISWDFFIAHGFSPNQTAGILGNLMQEHKFNTSDVPGGLGIAQWTGSRRSNLMARNGYDTIQVQLQYLMDELDGGYVSAKNAILASASLDESTEIFQNQFERCNPDYCMLQQRVQYGQEILAKHS